jgi:hypothetical protein
VCLYVYPLIVARQRVGENPLIVDRQWLGRNVTAVTNTHATIGELLVTFTLDVLALRNTTSDVQNTRTVLN